MRKLSRMPKHRPAHRKVRRPSVGAVILGIIGELCITVALVLGLYVFWELYWSSWEVEENREIAIAEFHAQLPPPVKEEGVKRTDAPPPFEAVGWGETIGVLHMTQWGMQIPVVEGTDMSLLDQALAGHYPTTDQAGDVGNFAIAAHRRTRGNNFRRIDVLEPGDRFVLETKDAWLVYEMHSREIVDPGAIDVLWPEPHEKDATPSQRLMTMTTCHPEFGSSERFIVYSELVYWMPRDSGTPEELKAEPAGSESDTQG